MRYILACALVLVCLMPSLVQADVFIKRHKTQKPQSSTPFTPKDDDIERTLNLTPKEEPLKGDEATMSKTLANQYYQNCLKSAPGIMTPDSHKALCGCTASEMMQTMSVEEVQSMFTQTDEGAYQRQRMMGLVYIPCMEYPVKDMIVNNCLSNKQVTQGLKKAGEVCNCLGADMGKFAVKNGSAMARQSLRNGADNIDIQKIMNDMMNSSNFAAKSKSVITHCMQKHELGW